MKRLILSLATAALLTGCQSYPYGAPDPYGPYPPQQQPYPPYAGTPPPQPSCPIVRSGDWNAWVNMMPGPNARPTLHVTGKVVVPSGGHSVGFDEQLQIRESYPAQAFATLRVTPPSGPATQALMTHEVRWQWPLTQPVGSLEIHCGSQTLATISQVQTAH